MVNILCVSLGAVLLIASLNNFRLSYDLPLSRAYKPWWAILAVFIIFFLFGYVAFVVALLSGRSLIGLESLVAQVFLWGAVFVLLVSAFFLMLARGQTNFVLAAMKTKEENERLKQADEKLKIKDQAIESALNALAISDLAGNLNYVNPSFLKMWGYSSLSEVAGRSAVEFWQTGEKAAEVMEAVRTRGGWIGELLARRKDGSLFDVQLVANTVLDISGQPVGLQASFMDISERRRAEGEIQESEKEFRSIFDNAGDGILIADPEKKKFVMGNNAICRMLGYRPEEIENLGVMDIHPEKDVPFVIDQFERQAKGEFSLSRDLPVKRKDGAVFYADINATTITIAGKTHLMGFFHDITERKQAAEQLAQKVKELEKMTKIMEGREDRIVELKNKVKELEAKLK